MRICANNFLDSNTTSSYSSYTSAGPFSNLFDPIRSRCWETNGNFTITSSNNSIYINDGSNKTVTLTSQNYSGGAALASHIQTQLNASSSNWTCTYSTTTNKFTIGHTGSATLRLSQSSNAAWSTIGFTTSIDLVGTSFISDTSRIHTSEWFVVDLGAITAITFFALIGSPDEIFPASTTATLRLYGNNIDDWSSPSFSATLSRLDGGIFYFPTSTLNYRYFKFEITDTTNPIGSNLRFGMCYVGDYITPTRNISNGFQKKINDPTTVLESETGTRFFNIKPKFTSFSSVTFQNMSQADREELLDLFNSIGKNNPFFISIDPSLEISTDIDQLTKYVYFDTEPSFVHVIYNLFSCSFELREAV